MSNQVLDMDDFMEEVMTDDIRDEEIGSTYVMVQQHNKQEYKAKNKVVLRKDPEEEEEEANFD